MADYLTETGYILSKCNYKDSEVERFDQLAFHLYCIPVNERKELLAALMFQFGITPKEDDYIAIMNGYQECLTARE